MMATEFEERKLTFYYVTFEQMGSTVSKLVGEEALDEVAFDPSELLLLQFFKSPIEAPELSVIESFYHALLLAPVLIEDENDLDLLVQRKRSVLDEILLWSDRELILFPLIKRLFDATLESDLNLLKGGKINFLAVREDEANLIDMELTSFDKDGNQSSFIGPALRFGTSNKQVTFATGQSGQTKATVGIFLTIMWQNKFFPHSQLKELQNHALPHLFPLWTGTWHKQMAGDLHSLLHENRKDKISNKAIEEAYRILSETARQIKEIGMTQRDIDFD